MGNLTTRIIRTREEIEDIRDLWVSWQSHPNSDIDFYLTVQRLRPKIVRPHVIVVYNDGRPTRPVGEVKDKPPLLSFEPQSLTRTRVINGASSYDSPAGFLRDLFHEIWNHSLQV